LAERRLKAALPALAVVAGLALQRRASHLGCLSQVHGSVARAGLQRQVGVAWRGIRHVAKPVRPMKQQDGNKPPF
jgi:hypothetical protein